MDKRRCHLYGDDYIRFSHLKRSTLMIILSFIILIAVEPSFSFSVSPSFTTISIRTNVFPILNPKSNKVPLLRNRQKSWNQSLQRLSATTSVSQVSDSETDQKQSMPTAVFNLVKACVGSGVLALSSGVASLGDSTSVLIPSTILVCFLGLLSGYTFFNIGRVCRLEGDASTLSEAWENEVGPKSAWLIGLCCVLTPLGAALSYSIILGDTFSSLAQFVGFKGFFATRYASILFLHMSVLYPLCSLKSLAALAPVSVFGVLGVLMTIAFMTIRIFLGSYTPNGALFSTLSPALQPSFDVVGVKPLLSLASLVLGSMTATAYLVHFNAPDFYKSLKDNTMERFGLVTTFGFIMTAFISVAMMALGFLTFGGNSCGMILNNYSHKDIGATFCRLLMGISLIGSYPFVFKAVKASLTTFITKGGKLTKELNTKLNQILLALLTSISLVIKDAGFVVSFNGAVMGSAIIYIFPSIIFLKSTKRRILNGDKDGSSKRVLIERFFNKILIGLGFCFGIMGGIASILNSFYPHLIT